MEYIYQIGWLCLWPIVIYISYKFALRNVRKFEERENI